MTPEEARRVHVNHCVRDDELAELDALCAAADAGDWRVVDGEVRRWGGGLRLEELAAALRADELRLHRLLAWAKEEGILIDLGERGWFVPT